MSEKDKDDFDMKDLYPDSVLDQIAKEERQKKEAEAKEQIKEQTEDPPENTVEIYELVLEPEIGGTDKQLRKLDIDAREAQRRLGEDERTLKLAKEKSEIGQQEQETDNIKGDYGREE